jgi:hypothetical protein
LVTICYQIVELKKAYWLAKGPFFLTSSGYQLVFKIAVRDREGQWRAGLVRCGSFWFGMFADQVEVWWDDEVSSPSQRLEPFPTMERLWDRQLDLKQA